MVVRDHDSSIALRIRNPRSQAAMWTAAVVMRHPTAQDVAEMQVIDRISVSGRYFVWTTFLRSTAVRNVSDAVFLSSAAVIIEGWHVPLPTRVCGGIEVSTSASDSVLLGSL